jgi:hypothetical protein
MAEARSPVHLETKECAEFLELIRKHFSYLFEGNEFEPIAAEEDRVGEHCLVILQSSSVRLKFIVDRGSVEATLGTLSSPLTWEDLPSGQVEWFSLREVAEYLRDEPRKSSKELQELGNRLFGMSPDEHLKWLSEMIRPVLGQAIQLFRGDPSSRAGLIEYYNS